MLLAVLDQLAGHQLVQAGDVPQQRHAGRVQIDADVVDARLDDAFQRFLQVLGVDVVLIQADADVLRIDLDQLAERILQAAADGDGAAQGGVEVGELLAADRAGGVDAGAGLVDDDVGEVGQRRSASSSDGEGGGAAAGRCRCRWSDQCRLPRADQRRRLGVAAAAAERGSASAHGRFVGSAGRLQAARGCRRALPTAAASRRLGSAGRRHWLGGGTGGDFGVGGSRRHAELGDQLGDELLRLAAGGAVADGDDLELMLADQLLELGLGLVASCSAAGAGR